MSIDPTTLPLDSDALKANLQETAAAVSIDPAYAPCRRSLLAVSRFQGLSTKLETLLYEISHPYRNWKLIIPDLRAFVLKNLNHYRDHEQGPEAFTLFTGIFFDAIRDTAWQRTAGAAQCIVEALLAYADKLIQSLDTDGLFRFEEPLSLFFARVQNLEQSAPQVVMSIVQGHHLVRRMAMRVVELRRKAPERPFDCRSLGRLVRTILRRNYEYWLGEEDPFWFEKQCGDYCREWHGQHLLVGISHDHVRRCLQTLDEVPSRATTTPPWT